jgi:PhnB protein
MLKANTYLYFDGNCRDAMTFYGKCFQTKPGFTPFSDVIPDLPESAKSAPERIVHSELASGPVVLMASDTLPGKQFRQGNNFSISISCDSLPELDRLFTEFSEHGEVTIPLHDAFWGGRMGILTDQFGVSWMFSFRSPGQHT